MKSEVSTSEIATLLRPFVELSPVQRAATLVYLKLLLKWNARTNLTAVRAPREMVARHFGESFFAAGRLLTPSSAESVIDVGSGAGFPGVPLAMFAPQAQVTLIESQGKKAAFLNEVIRSLGLRNAVVFQGRAETYAETADLVTMRAVEKFEEALPVAVRLVHAGGRLALMIGASQVERAEKRLTELDWGAPLTIPGGRSRVLLVASKSR